MGVLILSGTHFGFRPSRTEKESLAGGQATAPCRLPQLVAPMSNSP